MILTGEKENSKNDYPTNQKKMKELTRISEHIPMITLNANIPNSPIQVCKLDEQMNV